MAVLEGYKISHRVGTGAYGTAHLAHGPRGPVTLLVLDRGPGKSLATEHLDAEVNRLKGIVHHGFVHPIERIEHNGHRAIAFEKVDGVELATVLAAAELNLDTILYIVSCLAQGLLAIGPVDGGMAHGDLHPRNILLQFSGNVRIQQCGIASANPGKPDPEATAFYGTAAYQAPELQRGEPMAASDVYAVGVICWELLTGKRPGAMSDKELAYESQRQKSIGELRKLLKDDSRGEAVASLVDDATHFDPAKRMAAAEMVERCEPLIDEDVVDRWRRETLMPLASASVSYHSLPSLPPMPNPLDEPEDVDAGAPRAAIMVVAAAATVVLGLLVLAALT